MFLKRAVMAAALFALSAPCLAQEAVRPITGTRLDVVATGESTRVPDVVLVHAGASTQAPTAAEAIRGNAVKMDSLRAALRRAGIADRDVQTSSVTLNAQYRHRDEGLPEFLGYVASHTLSVRFRDAANAGRILDTLVHAGANEIAGPSFEVEAAEAALDEARLRALAAARARAEFYARPLGMRVARVLSVTEAVGSPFAAPSFRVDTLDARQGTNIALGEQQLSVALRISFELE